MKAFGWLLLGIGLTWAFIAFSMDTSVRVPYGSYGLPSRVENLSLIQQRNTHLYLAIGTSLAGVLLLGFGSLKEAQEHGRAGTRVCPFCAEPVREEAVLCRFCGRDLPEVESEDPDYPEGSTEYAEAQVDDEPRYSYRALSAAVGRAEGQDGGLDPEATDTPASSYRELRDAAEAAERKSQL